MNRQETQRHLKRLILPALLSYGRYAPLAGIRIGDKSLFVFMEYLVTSLMMPTGALLLSVFVAWRFGFDAFCRETNKGARRWRVTRQWQIPCPAGLYGQ